MSSSAPPSINSACTAWTCSGACSRIDAADYGIARVESVPAKRPSFWLSNVKIDKRMHPMHPTEGVWLTYRIDSSSDIRLAGNFRMQIEYSYDEVKVVGPDGNAQRPGGSFSE